MEKLENLASALGADARNLAEIERASIADLGKVPGVSAESARKIFEFFHAQPG